MPSRHTIVGCSVGSVLLLLILLMAPASAAAGQYTVGACQSDILNFNTRPFGDFATRGMIIRRACNPEGPGLRGLITTNAVRRKQLRRGAISMVDIKAPPGTHFTTFRWGGTLRRRDCRYALQLWAQGPPGFRKIPIANVRANQRCPRKQRAQIAGIRPFTYDVNGATRIVQRVVCVGGRGTKTCSASGMNYIRTQKAELGIVDGLPPVAAIVADTALARGAWVGGTQALNYMASDNVGVRNASAVVPGRVGGTHQRPCTIAAPALGQYADLVPCPNGPGQITVRTHELREGTQSLAVQAVDAGGNAAASAAVTARVDNTPPGRVDVALEGGEQWRNRNEYTVSWVNPTEPDRAPITAARYRLCPIGAGSCRSAISGGTGIARLDLQVPAQGEWKLSLWRRDAAGNETQTAESVPVTLRYDAEPPRLAFEPAPASDPTLVAVLVGDDVSGVAGGAIEIGRQGSNTWQALHTQKDGNRLVARIDDSALPAGVYLLRARARDQAGNEGSTALRADGRPMVLTLPLRIPSELTAGIVRSTVERRTVWRNGKRRQIRRPVTTLVRSVRVELGRQVKVAGRLANRDGQGVPGAQVRVLSRSAASPEQLVGVVQTDGEGRFSYTATGTMSRTLRFVYGGSPLILPAAGEVGLRVPAATSRRVDRRRVLNGQAVTFSGTVKSQPVPAAGKLVEFQVLLSGRWQTFRTTNTDGAGRWTVRYRFRRTRGVQRYSFRAALPSEAGYPFEAGASRPITVRVRGRR